MTEWGVYLYEWHHKYIAKMQEDLELLGCTAVVQNSFTLKQRCRIAGCELVSAAATVHTGKAGNTQFSEAVAQVTRSQKTIFRESVFVVQIHME